MERRVSQSRLSSEESCLATICTLPSSRRLFEVSSVWCNDGGRRAGIFAVNQKLNVKIISRYVFGIRVGRLSLYGTYTTFYSTLFPSFLFMGLVGMQ